MIYLANALFQPSLALEIHGKLLDRDITSYIPDVNIKYEGREININAFEQLRRRNPNNPYLIELKKQIIKELIENVILSSHIIICNYIEEILQDQTIFEISIAWFIKKPIFSYSNIQKLNKELLNALGNISLQGNLENFKLEKEEKSFTELKTEVFSTPKGKQKLTIQD